MVIYTFNQLTAYLEKCIEAKIVAGEDVTEPAEEKNKLQLWIDEIYGVDTTALKFERAYHNLYGWLCCAKAHGIIPREECGYLLDELLNVPCRPNNE